MTLLELLVVLAILSLLLGTGLGVLQRLRPGGRETSRGIAGMLRAARLRAVETGRPQRILIDAPRGTLALASWTPVVVERFDEGADRAGATPGTLGGGLALDPAREVSVSMPGARPGARRGVRVELDLRWMEGTGAVVRAGGALELVAEPDGSLRARARPSDLPALEAQTSPGKLAEGRFLEIAVTWLPGVLTVEREGVEVARAERGRGEAGSPGFETTSVRLGDEEGTLTADVDELRVWSLREGEEVRVPSGARIARAPAALAIDARGFLDPSRHPEPPRLEIENPEGENRVFVIDREARLHEGRKQP